MLLYEGVTPELLVKMQERFFQALHQEKPKKKPVSVDMAAKLKEQGLLAHFPAELWPPAKATREWAAKLKDAREKEEAGKYAFVYTDLKK